MVEAIAHPSQNYCNEENKGKQAEKLRMRRKNQKGHQDGERRILQILLLG